MTLCSTDRKILKGVKRLIENKFKHIFIFCTEFKKTQRICRETTKMTYLEKYLSEMS